MLELLENYVMLEEEAYKSDSTLILADNPNIERQIILEVKNVGPEVKKVKIGDRIMAHHHMFNQTMIDKKMYLIGSENHIYAKVT